MRYWLRGRKSEKSGCADENPESLKSLAARTKARTYPVRSDNRWQRQAELSPKKNYYASSRRAAHCQVLLRTGSHPG